MGLEDLADKVDKIFIPTSLIRSYGREFLMIPELKVKEFCINMLFAGELLRVGAYATLVYYLS